MKKINVMMLFVIITFCFPASWTNAAVIDFEDLYTGGFSNQFLYNYGGFNWSGAGYITGKLYQPYGTGIGNGTIGNVSLHGTRDGEEKAGPTAFAIQTGYFNFLGAYVTPAWFTGVDVKFEGWRDGSKIYEKTITSYIDKPYWFDFNFYNVDKIWLLPNHNTGTYVIAPDPRMWARQVVLDNITYSTTPLPGTIMLLGSGIIGLILCRKKN